MGLFCLHILFLSNDLVLLGSSTHIAEECKQIVPDQTVPHRVF